MSIVNGVKIGTMCSAANGDTYADGERHQFRTWQALVQPNVRSLALATPPGSPSNGDTYVVAAAPTGAWTGKANSIAYWAVDAQDGPSITPNIATGAWEFYTPQAGWLVFDNNTSLTWKFSGSAWGWTKFSGVASISTSTSVGVSFPVTFTGTAAPIVTVTAVGSDAFATNGWWVTNLGGAGAWTGFTLHIHTSGTQTFNYSVAGF